ncbi:MAG: packaged DNA stabilization protein, partial [Nitrosomonadaceae bacterium]
SYDALDFGTAEADPDDITGIHVNRNQLYIGGGQTIEPFANIGGAGFPFQRISGGVVPKGVKAKFSMVEFDDSYVFVGGGLNEQHAVWKFTGSSGQKISTAAVDLVLQSLIDEDQEDIFCTVYGEYGGFFLNVHTSTRVLTFDSLATALSGNPVWHERQSKDRFGRSTIWRVNGILNAYGKTLVTDNQDGRVGDLDRDLFTEYGDNIKRTFSTVPFRAEGENITVAEMELTCESGVGLGADDEPFISREFSDNGGQTFGNKTSRSLGKEGEYNKRQIWRREGQLRRFRVYRFTMSEPVKPVVIKLEADFILDPS